MHWESPPFPFVGHLERNFEAIRDEEARLGLAHNDDWPDVDAYSGGWKAFGLLSRDPEVQLAQTCAANAQRCPRSVAILRRIPGLVRAGFSLLLPGTHILPHADSLDGRLRCHLTLRTNPGAAIRFAGATLFWREGRCLVFDGSHHEVVNLGGEPRVVCLVDLESEAAWEIVE